ncbi:MAG TPA: TIGR00282 family metallophosphoesterase [Aliidongia sp.]|nr:TIGR00282 family metallophosphoesterase [Aliidongia sp.]
MRLLFLGDLVGRSGRDAALAEVPRLRAALGVDFCVVNGENAAGGFGITDKICKSLYEVGVDAITTGNHVWDQRELMSTIDADPRLVRPANFPPGTPGKGTRVFQLAGGRRIVVVNVMLRLFMDALDDPFQVMDRELAGRSLGNSAAAILVDVHGEATSEKMAMGHFLDGRASLVVGTHSHVPTADAQILPKGTAYLSDAGMCGDYDSVIGMQKEAALHRFTRKLPGERLTPAEGPATVCGVFVETDDATGLAKSVSPIRVGGRLQPAWPPDPG